MRGSRLLWVFSRRNHTETLALPVRHIATMVNDDMASLSRSFGTYKPLHRDNGGRVRFLWLVCVERWLLGILQMEWRNSDLTLALLLN
uniref:FENR2 n=1 Tax=Arundo donax TaxID=35708 RepID=A0A0A9GYD7_ARUDO